MNLTIVQKIALSIAGLGFLAASGTQLTDIFAPFGSTAPLIVKEIVSVSTFVSGGLGVILTFITGQSSQITAVRAMPGVEKILVNEKANATLATMAVAQEENKIEATPQAQKAVEATAKAAL